MEDDGECIYQEDLQCEVPQDFIAVTGKENHDKRGPISPVSNSVSPPLAPPHAPRGRGRRRTGDRSEDTRSVGRDSVSSGGSMEVASPVGSGKFDVSIVSEVVQNNIRQILEENRAGIWAIQLPAVYTKRYGKELSFRDYGYWSLVEMLDSLPDLIRLERPTDNGDWLCFDARLPVQTKPVVQKQKVPPKRETVSKGRFSSRGEFDSQLEEKIRQVLQCKPEGVDLNGFPGLYKELTGEVLPFRELGYDKIEFFMIPLADSVVHLEYKGDGCMLVYALDNGKPPRRDLIINPPQDELQGKHPTKNIPSDAVGPKVYYKPQELPPLHEYIEIFVSNVVSPGLFWMQVRGKRTTFALDKCMNELEKLYCSAEGDQYKVPDYLLTVGQIVAAIFPEDNNWHRCVVTALNVDKYVEVYFVDFGNTSLVHRRNIRLLRSKLLKLPAQAIQARLAHLQPLEGSWTLNARNRFLNLVTNRPLISLVNFEKDRVLSLVLVDTSTKVDVCLNDLLVTEGYARVEEDNLATNFTGPAGLKEVPDYSHVYGEGFELKVEVEPAVQPSAVNKPETELTKRYVQPIQLTGEYIVNLINLNDTAYLMSTEVSAFFWEADILTGMLEQKNVSVSRLTLKHEQYPEVFEDLRQCGVIQDSEKKFITLYELNRVPFILDMFDHQCEELQTNVRELIQMFDPCDPYWKGEDYPDSENASQASEDLSDFQVSLEDIQLSLQLLQFKRKRILQNLMTHPENMEDNVNKLKEVEDQISVLKDMQDQQRQRKALDPDTPEKSVKTSCPGPTGAATSDDKVKATISEGMFERSRLSPLKGMPQTGTPPSSVSPIKTNVVAPMQNNASQAKPATSCQSHTTPPTNQEFINTLAQQQLLLQTMMMPQAAVGAQIPSLNNQFVRGAVPFQQPHSAMNQQYAANPRVPDMSMQYLATNQTGMNHQLVNQQFAATSQASMTPQLMNMMQANLAANPYMMGMPPYMGGMAQQTQSQPQANVPLLSGLLPLLQTLNINQSQGSSKGKPS
ncbi:uncharacterized protein LOC117344681 [Pecten maximus]|uniref:uncharacterized protein LOC117344681 n=1 Tax=Pecten maximus TaxID=6579 RepID=UPI0014581C59|nr:uncharacterized protein LOC117344681 [Pecten maximus]